MVTESAGETKEGTEGNCNASISKNSKYFAINSCFVDGKVPSVNPPNSKEDPMVL